MVCVPRTPQLCVELTHLAQDAKIGVRDGQVIGEDAHFLRVLGKQGGAHDIVGSQIIDTLVSDHVSAMSSANALHWRSGTQTSIQSTTGVCAS